MDIDILRYLMCFFLLGVWSRSGLINCRVYVILGDAEEMDESIKDGGMVGVRGF